MTHHHQWQSHPPEGKLSLSKSWDENYGDEEDMAANDMFNSPEEIQRLRGLLEKDPGFENSSSWPHLVQWCSSCKETRAVRLVLPKEEIKPVGEEEETLEAIQEEGCIESKSLDACTQTPRPKQRRRGGQGSRTRRLLAFQAMLTVKRGLPLSRLLSHQGTNTRFSKAEINKLQEESASPTLKPRRVVVEIKKEEKKEDVAVPAVKEEKEEVICPGEEVSSSESNNFTLRNFQTGANQPSSQPLPQQPATTPFSVLPPPLLSSPFSPFFQTPQFCQMPAANPVFCGACMTWGTVVPVLVVQ